MSFTNDDRFLRQATELERRRQGMEPRSLEVLPALSDPKEEQTND